MIEQVMCDAFALVSRISDTEERCITKANTPKWLKREFRQMVKETQKIAWDAAEIVIQTNEFAESEDSV